MIICDAHAHPGDDDERKVRQQHRIATFMCGTNPESARLVENLCRGSEIFFPTYGLHPWYADKYQVEDMIPFLRQGKLLGEIGMDSVWCDVDLGLQREVFVQQLELAEEYKMPVVLHTKGQEKEILECIEPYHVPFLVHWYSSDQYLDGYREKDCFFSLGPDVLFHPAVGKIVESVCLDRLLVETDGMEAVRWAVAQNHNGACVENKDLPNILRASIEYIGQVKGISVAVVEKQLVQNFHYLKDRVENKE